MTTFDHSSPDRVPPTPMSAVRGCWPDREHQKYMANRYECPSCGALPGEPCHADCMDGAE
jgi:hypothetical protein